METACSVMFLLGIGEILEEWTHKKSVDDLVRSMSLNIDKVWLVGSDGIEVLVDSNQIKEGDKVVVHMGNVIPFDGTVTDGDAMVNQASMTGESLPVQKEKDSSVYAGTVVEEGKLTICVKEVSGSGRFDKIVTMIEESEKLKSQVEGKAEHFPYSMAKAVVDAAAKKGLEHEEEHTKVEYIVAHGISTFYNGRKTIIGSSHFVFEDEKCVVPKGMEGKFNNLPLQCSHLYLAIENELAGVICIEDPLRDEAEAVINSLKKAGLSKVVMMTGDSERTASVIAKRVGVDEYYSEVLPEDKAKFVEKEKSLGRKVIMIGDGVNDSPALSAADVGIAISDGAQIAREIADVTIGADSLYEIVTLKAISNGLMKKIHKNYKDIAIFNTGLIVLGVAGIIQPTLAALLHNTSTLLISLRSMQNLLDD